MDRTEKQGSDFTPPLVPVFYWWPSSIEFPAQGIRVCTPPYIGRCRYHIHLHIPSTTCKYCVPAYLNKLWYLGKGNWKFFNFDSQPEKNQKKVQYPAKKVTGRVYLGVINHHLRFQHFSKTVLFFSFNKGSRFKARGFDQILGELVNHSSLFTGYGFKLPTALCPPRCRLTSLRKRSQPSRDGGRSRPLSARLAINQSQWRG